MLWQAGEGNPIVYYKVTDDWPAASQTLRPEKKRITSLSGFHHSVHTGHWSGRCLLAQSLVDGVLLKAGGRYSWPSLRQTRRLLLQGGGGQPVRCIKTVWQSQLSVVYSQLWVSLAGESFCVNMRRGMDSEIRQMDRTCIEIILYGHDNWLSSHL